MRDIIRHPTSSNWGAPAPHAKAKARTPDSSLGAGKREAKMFRRLRSFTDGEHDRCVRQRMLSDGVADGSVLAFGAADLFELFEYPAQIVETLFGQATDSGAVRRLRMMRQTKLKKPPKNKAESDSNSNPIRGGDERTENPARLITFLVFCSHISCTHVWSGYQLSCAMGW